MIRLVIFQNYPNTTRRFAARGILGNFEISLAVLLPNTTTSHAITYTNTMASYARMININSVNRG